MDDRLSDREHRLLAAAENVCSLWRALQEVDGRLGATSLARGLDRLQRACDLYESEVKSEVA